MARQAFLGKYKLEVEEIFEAITERRMTCLRSNNYQVMSQDFFIW